MDNAQLFWVSREDIGDTWLVRYRDPDGTELEIALDAPPDARVSELALLLAYEAIDLGLSGEVRVLRGDARPGRIEFTDGVLTAWREAGA